MAIGTTAAIAMGVGAGTNILGGLFGARGAKKAARIQAEAAERGARSIEQATGAAQETIREGMEWANQNVDQGVERGTAVQTGARDASLGYLDPYMQAGGGAITRLSDLVGPEGEFGRKITMEDLELDPGFAFRLSEGEKALQRSAAARGMLSSGRTLKALTGYAQGVASEEYQRAFDRFRADRADRFGMLSDVAGFGERATNQAVGVQSNYGNQVGGYNVGAGQYKAGVAERGFGAQADIGLEGTTRAADIRMGGANARAAGAAASGRAWGNAIAGAGSTAADILMLSSMNKQAPQNMGWQTPGYVPTYTGPGAMVGGQPWLTATGGYKPVPYRG